MAIYNSNIGFESTPLDASYYTNTPTGQSDTRNYMSNLGTIVGDSSMVISTTYTLYENNYIKITYHTEDYATGAGAFINYIRFTEKEHNYNSQLNSLMSRAYIAIGLDDENQKAYFFIVNAQNSNPNNWNGRNNSIIGSTTEIQTAFYLAIKQSQLIQYTWTSVPAISGKNGILLLPVLIDTDGNPVSNGSVSDFSTLPDSVKVRTLADLAVQ